MRSYILRNPGSARRHGSLIRYRVRRLMQVERAQNNQSATKLRLLKRLTGRLRKNLAPMVGG